LKERTIREINDQIQLHERHIYETGTLLKQISSSLDEFGISIADIEASEQLQDDSPEYSPPSHSTDTNEVPPPYRSSSSFQYNSTQPLADY